MVPTNQMEPNSRKRTSRKSPLTISFIVGMLDGSAELDTRGNEQRKREAYTLGSIGEESIEIQGTKYQVIKLPPNSWSLGVTLSAQILAGQAAELALKYAYEQENPSKTAPQIHRLDSLYFKLGEETRRNVEDDFATRKERHSNFIWPGWETAKEVFYSARDYPVWARYATEEQHQPREFQPILLREAVCSVLASMGYNVRWGVGS